jgi:hypothetical protein
LIINFYQNENENAILATSSIKINISNEPTITETQDISSLK